MSNISILIVEDNLLVSTTVKDILTDEGYSVDIADDGKSAEKFLLKSLYQVIILDMMLPDIGGKKLLEQWQKQYPESAIIIMTAYGDVGSAVECLKLGAYDFLTKPVDKTLLLKTLSAVSAHLKLTKKVNVLTQLTQRETETSIMGPIIGKSIVLKEAMVLAKKIALSDYSCLFINGESGTGKGLFAKTIHKMGKRSNKPFVELNCSAIPLTLIESELFGHKKGAFTDAKEDKVGLFELADGGTLFLDEIGDMDISVQVKLLKAIEEQQFRRIGGIKDLKVDVCIIAATNQNVEKAINDGKFRLDLYYRLNVIPFQVPPLREHAEDIPLLADHFIQLFSRKFGKEIQGFSENALEALMEYSWPGNVREFRNVAERGCILASGSIIDKKELIFPNMLAPTLGSSQSSISTLPAMPLAKAESLVIQAAMQKANGNKNKAARILGVHRTTLYKKLEEYSIISDEFSASDSAR